MNEIRRQLRCVLTGRELLEAGKRSAELTREICALEEDKARVSKDFAARIASREADRSILTDKITSGYEFRDVTCRVDLNSPKVGVKTIVRLDTAEDVAVEQMTPDELQEKLPLEETTPAPPAADETQSDYDSEVDSTALEAICEEPLSSAAYKNALDSANQGTLNAALAKVGQKSRRRSIEAQLGKLVAAKAAAGNDFQWDDGECSNPWIVRFEGCPIPFAVEVAKHPADNRWYGGLQVSDVERDRNEDLSTDNVGMPASSAIDGMMFETTRAHFEKRRFVGDRKAREMVAILDKKKSAFLYAVENAGAKPSQCDLAA